MKGIKDIRKKADEKKRRKGRSKGTHIGTDRGK
jgi:hypothetical protein